MRRVVRSAAVMILLGTAVALLAVSGLLAVLRAGSQGTSLEIELVAFTPVGLPLAFAGLVLAWVLWSRVRVMAVLAVAVSLTFAVLHAWWLTPLYVGSQPAAAQGPEIVVMTQNFEEGDAGDLLALVEHYRVDVLLLTDCPPAQLAEIEDSDLRGTLAHTTLGDGGSIIWSRFPILRDSFISEGGDSRVVTLDVPGAALDVVAVHPTPPYQDGGSGWVKDWGGLLGAMTTSYGSTVDRRVVVAGDLNASRDHAPMRALEGMGMRDAGEQLNLGLLTTWPANGREHRLGITLPALLHLDHVLTSPALVPTELVVTDAAGSDHHGVIATIAPAAG